MGTRQKTLDSAFTRLYILFYEQQEKDTQKTARNFSIIKKRSNKNVVATDNRS